MTLRSRVKTVVLGRPRDIEDPQLFHKVSLIAFLAWVGLGADGLSSSCYGPDETFRGLGEHRELAIFLALATALTVFIISATYSQIIEHFPTGGGGYLVATKLLGAPAGVVSGCALLIDYVLTITVSITAGAEAIFAFLPHSLHGFKLPVEYGAIGALILLNLRGVKESIMVLVPIFLLFVATHAVMLLAVVFNFFNGVPEVFQSVTANLHNDYHSSLGLSGMFFIFAAAYARGCGTFTGIEAVSNGLAILREPKVATGKRTMLYMALSLAVMASGILLVYLLADARVDPAHPTRPLNAVLLERLAGRSYFFGNWFVVLTLFAEAMLLLIAAQTGFVGGPRVMANMALDSWLPHRFSSLSERLTTHYGVVLIGAASLLALLYTQGDVEMLVIMYSINVFITFSLSQLGMCRFYLSHRHESSEWKHGLPIQLLGLSLCTTILILVVVEKFTHGAWMTLAVTSLLIGLCVLIRRYYNVVYSKLGMLPLDVEIPEDAPIDPALDHLDLRKPTAALLVGGYGGLGIHSLLSIRRNFPSHFKQVIFVSVGVIDSGNFKGSGEVEALKRQTQAALDKYVLLAKKLGMAASSTMTIGNEPVEPAAELCTELALRYKQVMFFAGKLVFQRESIFQRLLHNETAIAIQNRLQWLGYPMVVLPVRIWGVRKKGSPPPPAARPISQS